ncbi:hypothetical protein GBA65_07150 [Rubrobacter marinus]|uniref:Uncharacterized protein n=1 Tax=Rubrobacter marinus TaxID=2653852 RepID=A0A6G8PVU0_9ACTN|nr:hypothetical protein [Rubrobacter marinus]QIN78331.1 hypothetical protein GBA65_07150 [Rubrobacter marinus]
MGLYANNLHRLARFLAGAPPDAATMVLAILGRPDLLVGFAAWAWSTAIGDVFMTVVLLILGVWVWPRLPYPVRQHLLALREHFLPFAGSDGPPPYEQDRAPRKAGPRAGEPPLEEVELLRQELKAYEKRLEDAEAANLQQSRRMERLERESEEARRPWWRFFSR